MLWNHVVEICGNVNKVEPVQRKHNTWKWRGRIEEVTSKPAFKKFETEMIPLSKLLIFGLLVASAASEAEDVAATEEANNEARVLVGKHIQNKYLVEGMDLVVKYSLFNIGDAAAVDLTLTENGFGMDDFDIVGGQPSVKYDRLAPGANATHALVLRPTKFGYFNFTAAEVKYKVNEEEDSPVKLGFSSEPGQGLIIALRDYERQFSAHTVSFIWKKVFKNVNYFLYF